ncbi:uncharacterized protein IL334_003868 [Kwoniella shivajii]|uniref:separase n=1 Tax=Kwoniella shivajii TaxID=564305 RepID=A0ABZ1CYT7_9TREE|nr:hypothetical protein IL334_003868 [Kwoniella shivajii]
MAIAKAVSASKTAPPAVPRKTRTAAASKTRDADELVEGLGKLSIAQPTQTVKRVTRAAPTASSSSARPTPTTTTKKATTTVDKPKIATISAHVPTAGRSTAASVKTSAKGKGKASTLEDTFPWARPSLSSDEPILKPIDRVRAAMQAVNTSSKSFSSAVSSGFRYNSPTSSSSTSPSVAPIAKDVEEPWTDAKIDHLVETCQIGFRVLRELDQEGHLPGKAEDVERSVMAVMGKCISLGMYRKAMEILTDARLAQLRLYTPRPMPKTPAPSVTSTSTIPKGQFSTSTIMNTTVLKDTSARPRLIPSTKVKSPSEVLSREWLDAARLPAPEKGSNLSEVVKGILFSAIMGSWICLVSLSKDPEVLLPVLTLPLQNSSEEELHPLILALSLPRNSIIVSLRTFYRQVGSLTLSPGSRPYLRIRHLSLLAMGITISPSPDSRPNLEQYWDTVHRSILTFVKEDEEKERLADAASTIGQVVDFIEIMVEKRKEKGWFEGKAWFGLVEMWIGIGRRLGNSDIIDKPLSLLTAPTSIDSSSSSPPHQVEPSTPPSSSSIAVLKTPISKSSVRKIRNPEGEIARICGDLAKANLTIDKLLSAQSASPPNSITGLGSDELIFLAQSIASLSDQEEPIPTAGKAIRAFERVRRCCSRLLIRYLQPDASEACRDVAGEIKIWMEKSIEFVEIVIEASVLDSTLTKELLSSVVDTTVRIFQPPAGTYFTSLQYLTRARVVFDRTASLIEDVDKSEWLRCLSAFAYNGTAHYYRLNQIDEALPLSRISCQWGVEAMSLHTYDLTDKDDKPFSQLREGMSKRWELLASCYQREGKKDEMFTAFSNVFTFQTPSILSHIAASSSTKPIEAVFEPLTEIKNSLVRLANLIMYEPALYISHGKELVQSMRQSSCPTNAIGAIGEKLLSLLEQGEGREQSAKVSLEIADAILEVYGDEYPIRRLRLLAKMMSTILTSGQAMDRLPPLVEEVDRLSDRTDLCEDNSLSPFKSEYISYTLILRAMQAYHTSPHPSMEVIESSKKAVENLRGIVLPPTKLSTLGPSTESADNAPKKKVPLGRSTTTKAVPARPTRGTSRTVSEPKKVVGKKPLAKSTTATVANKSKRRSSIILPLVFDDLKRLTRLLGSLATLLGLLGHSLQQIEALKLLRAFQRNREDLVDDYVLRSAQLATEYQKLGKISRAGLVFSQAQKVMDNSNALVSTSVKVELGLRYASYLAFKGDFMKAQEVYSEAAIMESETEASKIVSSMAKAVERCEKLERTAWARRAAASIYAAQGNAAAAITHLSASFRLFIRAADAICRLAPNQASAEPSNPISEDDPFSAPPPQAKKSVADAADEPSKDSKIAVPSQTTHFSGKHLHALQWRIASSLLTTTFDVANALAYRGTVRDTQYFLNIAGNIAESVKSDVIKARVGAKEAELFFRMRKWDEMGEKLELAAASLNTIEGPDMIDLNVLKGDLYSRTEMVEEAEVVFQTTSKEIEGLDRVFVANEAVLPTPKKNVLLTASTSSVRASLTNSKIPQGREPILPTTLAHVLRQHAWLLKEAGSKEECEELLLQIKGLPSSTQTKADELLLEGRIALHEAFNTFKTDLFMSSLTESAVAMPMGAPTKRVVDRQSTRQSIQSVLTRAEEAFLSALSLVSGSGKIEDIRQACLALALLRAFQTSLGQGSEEVTAAAAGMLASSSSITLHRELLEAIESKFVDAASVSLEWHSFSCPTAETKMDGDDSIEICTEDLDDHNGKLRSYWEMVKAKYLSNPLLPVDSSSLNSLPTEWAVISINVTDDHNTMFISRHQRNHQPIVFCLPLDRQSRREGEDDLWTFDSALAELEGIIKSSDEGARAAKTLTEREDKLAWWENRFALDRKLKELCEGIEFVWLGAFKTIFSPRLPDSRDLIVDLRDRLEKIFSSALASTSGGIKNPRSKTAAPKVELDDALLECFVNLNSKCKDEEVEDLVYFILDVYQFHGVPVALSELDIDQISIDVKAALEKIETRIALSGLLSSAKDEHIFLALDKNVQPFPWESIPILRGRPISRIPSLSFLLDQVAMGNHLRPSLTQSTIAPPASAASGGQVDMRRAINSRRTFYILNPSGDLVKTEQHFKAWIDHMVDKAGWKGIIGRPPTELELTAALKDYDLVLYFGHGGAEQYIRSHKIRNLPQCATTMLWGCSSGLMKEQGDFDRTGTAWNYMIGGCPSLVANLWDVTDRDIDRLSSHVIKLLHLDQAHIPKSKDRSNTLLPLSELSTVQAVNLSREECKLKYMTGAAVVVYGLPVWMH